MVEVRARKKLLLLLPLRPRQPNTCAIGQLYYQCASPRFIGCCSVDACVAGGCPDDGSSTTAGAAAGTTTSASPQQTVSPSKTSLPPTVTVTNSVLSTVVSTATGDSQTSTAVGPTITAPSAAQGQLPREKSSTNAGPIIAGSVIAGVALMIVLAVVYAWCWRSRRWKRRRLQVERMYSKGTLSTDPDEQEVGGEERGGGGFLSIARNLGRPRQSRTRRLTTTSEISWLNPNSSPQKDSPSLASPGMQHQSEHLLAAEQSPELDGQHPVSRLSELPGSSPNLSSSIRCVELPDSDANVMKLASSPLLNVLTMQTTTTPKTSPDMVDVEEGAKTRDSVCLDSPTLPTAITRPTRSSPAKAKRQTKDHYPAADDNG